MSHLWIKAEAEASSYAVLPLHLSRYALGVDGGVRVGAVNQDERAPAVLLQSGENGKGSWALVWPTGGKASLFLNGLPAPAGVWVLRDRDELRVGDAEPMFFSTERLPTIEVFAGAGHPIRCARCQQEIEVGAEAVRCPACEVWHHQSQDRPCWTGFAEDGQSFASCTLCDHPTALGADAQFRWTPEGL